MSSWWLVACCCVGIFWFWGKFGNNLRTYSHERHGGLCRPGAADASEHISTGGRRRILFVITGGTRGIGREAARIALSRSSENIVILGIRGGPEACFDLKTYFRTQCRIDRLGERLILLPLDLSSFESVRTFAKEALDRAPNGVVDVLVNCAHFSGLKRPTRTKDGVEISYQVNHLSHFLLTLRLLPGLRQSRRGGRVVHVTSRCHKLGRVARKQYGAASRNLDPGTYDGSRVYPDTKLFQVLFSLALQSRLDGADVPVVSQAVHPGSMVRTSDSGRWLRGPEFCWTHRLEPLAMALFGSSLHEAGDAVYEIATSVEAGRNGGRYWHGKREEAPFLQSSNSESHRADAEWLWNVSCEITGESSLFATPTTIRESGRTRKRGGRP